MGLFEEIGKEVERLSHAGGGEFDHPDGTWEGGMRKYQRVIARDACDRAARQGTLTFAHMFDAKAREVLAEEDKIKLRAVLIDVAVCCVLWIDKLDREVG